MSSTPATIEIMPATRLIGSGCWFFELQELLERDREAADSESEDDGGDARANHARKVRHCMADNNNARDHLANERTFLAWIRTGVATIVFGFAVGRFSIALQEFLQFEKKPATTPINRWLGMISIVAGVLLIVCGTLPYRQTAWQIDTNSFQPAGAIIDLVAFSRFSHSSADIWRGSRSLRDSATYMANQNEKELADGRASSWSREMSSASHRLHRIFCGGALGERVKAGLKIIGIPTSVATAELPRCCIRSHLGRAFQDRHYIDAQMKSTRFAADQGRRRCAVAREDHRDASRRWCVADRASLFPYSASSVASRDHPFARLFWRERSPAWRQVANNALRDGTAS